MPTIKVVNSADNLDMVRVWAEQTISAAVNVRAFVGKKPTTEQLQQQILFSIQLMRKLINQLKIETADVTDSAAIMDRFVRLVIDAAHEILHSPVDLTE